MQIKLKISLQSLAYIIPVQTLKNANKKQIARWLILFPDFSFAFQYNVFFYTRGQIILVKKQSLVSFPYYFHIGKCLMSYLVLIRYEVICSDRYASLLKLEAFRNVDYKNFFQWSKHEIPDWTI